MIDKVYVLETSAGCWDDFRWITVGIYTDPVTADQEKQKFITEVTTEKSRYTPEESERFDKQSEEMFELNISDEKWPQPLTDWWGWKYNSDKNININDTKVTEQPLNQRLFTI
jgi:hypothetical protein